MIAFITLLAFAVPQQPADSARLSRDLEHAIQQLQDLELQRISRPVLARKAVVLEKTNALLDTVVLQKNWGRGQLSLLRRRFPGSILLLDFDARLAAQQKRYDDALALLNQLVRATPTDTAVQRRYAALLDEAGRTAEARTAYTRVLELTPEDAAAFRALVRLGPDTPALTQLLARIRRMQLRVPDSRPLKDREIELLYKLGRNAEADSVIRALKGHSS